MKKVGNRLKFRPVEFPATSGSLVYRPEEYSFDFVSRVVGCRSILVNELQLEVSEDGLLVYAWGMCPYPGWVLSRAAPNRAERSALAVSGIEQIPLGVSVQLSEERWVASWNPNALWLLIAPSDDVAGHRLIEFADGCVAVLSGEDLVGVWLHPQEGVDGLRIGQNADTTS